jgi:hypothetical protein
MMIATILRVNIYVEPCVLIFIVIKVENESTFFRDVVYEETRIENRAR